MLVPRSPCLAPTPPTSFFARRPCGIAAHRPSGVHASMPRHTRVLGSRQKDLQFHPTTAAARARKCNVPREYPWPSRQQVTRGGANWLRYQSPCLSNKMAPEAPPNIDQSEASGGTPEYEAFFHRPHRRTADLAAFFHRPHIIMEC